MQGFGHYEEKCKFYNTKYFLGILTFISLNPTLIFLMHNLYLNQSASVRIQRQQRALVVLFAKATHNEAVTCF